MSTSTASPTAHPHQLAPACPLAQTAIRRPRLHRSVTTALLGLTPRAVRVNAMALPALVIVSSLIVVVLAVVTQMTHRRAALLTMSTLVRRRADTALSSADDWISNFKMLR